MFVEKLRNITLAIGILFFWGSLQAAPFSWQNKEGHQENFDRNEGPSFNRDVIVDRQNGPVEVDCDAELIRIPLSKSSLEDELIEAKKIELLLREQLILKKEQLKNPQSILRQYQQKKSNNVFSFAFKKNEHDQMTAAVMKKVEEELELINSQYEDPRSALNDLEKEMQVAEKLLQAYDQVSDANLLSYLEDWMELRRAKLAAIKDEAQQAFQNLKKENTQSSTFFVMTKLLKEKIECLKGENFFQGGSGYATKEDLAAMKELLFLNEQALSATRTVFNSAVKSTDFLTALDDNSNERDRCDAAAALCVTLQTSLLALQKSHRLVKADVETPLYYPSYSHFNAELAYSSEMFLPEQRREAFYHRDPRANDPINKLWLHFASAADMVNEAWPLAESLFSQALDAPARLEAAAQGARLTLHQKLDAIQDDGKNFLKCALSMQRLIDYEQRQYQDYHAGYWEKLKNGVMGYQQKVSEHVSGNLKAMLQERLEPLETKIANFGAAVALTKAIVQKIAKRQRWLNPLNFSGFAAALFEEREALLTWSQKNAATFSPIETAINAMTALEIPNEKSQMPREKKLQEKIAFFVPRPLSINYVAAWHKSTKAPSLKKMATVLEALPALCRLYQRSWARDNKDGVFYKYKKYCHYYWNALIAEEDIASHDFVRQIHAFYIDRAKDKVKQVRDVMQSFFDFISLDQTKIGPGQRAGFLQLMEAISENHEILVSAMESIKKKLSYFSNNPLDSSAPLYTKVKALQEAAKDHGASIYEAMGEFISIINDKPSTSVTTNKTILALPDRLRADVKKFGQQMSVSLAKITEKLELMVIIKNQIEDVVRQQILVSRRN